MYYYFQTVDLNVFSEIIKLGVEVVEECGWPAQGQHTHVSIAADMSWHAASDREPEPLASVTKHVRWGRPRDQLGSGPWPR